MNSILSLIEKDSKPKLNKFIKGITILFTIIILSLIITTITFLFSRSVSDLRYLSIYCREGLLVLMNFIPVFILMAFVYLISNRLWISFIVNSFVFVTMSLVNKFKLTYRDDPFTFIDLKLFKESLIMAEKYSLGLSPKVIIMIVGLFIIALLLRKFFDLKVNSFKVRTIFIVLLCIITYIIFNGFYFDSKIYAEVGDKSTINIWIQSQQFQSKGFIYPFIYSATYSKEVELEGYDEERAIKDLNQYEYTNIPEGEKVNIIAIMLEAYNDFSEFENLELGIDVYKNYHELQKESIHGKLVTNIFAGGTIDTERAFLTGYYTHPKYYRKTNSFVWYLNEQGYKTEAMHPITGSFYNRRNVNNYLGFSEFEHFDNKYKEVQSEYLWDKDFFDYIIEGHENSKNNGESYFNFSVTYQNHGPYSSEKYTEEQFLKKQTGYDDANYNIINNYLHGINETDKAIKELVDYFRSEDEPTIIVLFGDHNPWLGTDNSGYKMLDINLDLSDIQGFKNYYQTPYLIWANDTARKTLNKEFVGEGNTISPNFLMTELFDYIGWEGNEYMQYVSNLKEKLDVNHEIFFKENGEYKNKSEIENKEAWTDFLNVQHYYSLNFKE